MHLLTYLRQKNLSELAFATAHSFPQSVINRICRGGGCNARTALALKRATNGRVTLEGLVEGYEGARKAK